MIKLQFKCRLLSEVILSQKAATEGNHETLDFIPGGVFLGIAATGYNNYTSAEQSLLFHSGRVRFGDAHPVTAQANTRSLHIPAAIFYPKLSGLTSSCFLSYFHDRNKEQQPLQLKQCRQGFYIFDDKSINEIVLNKSFAIKSAYNRELRRSEDNKMYGYESLCKGATFLFSVECDDDALAPKIKESLIGTKHIGRSRTAQYGLAEITPFEFRETESKASTFQQGEASYITVYADGRLIFIDEYGEPTFTPQAKDFGLDGEIVWEESQVRTFQYAPWNGKRQTRDADRTGFEKGSTFVIRLNDCKLPSSLPSYVGSYQNEGFGKVIYGWDLLQQSGDNGIMNAKFSTHLPVVEHAHVNIHSANTPLLQYLARKKKESEASAYVYREVNEFQTQYGRLFPTSFASQWGAIRSIATSLATYDKIVEELFNKTIIEKRKPSSTDSRTEVPKPMAFLTHGIASDKWNERGRREVLKDFVHKMGKNPIYGDLSQIALINLSSEMAKNGKD